jgi:hypothetical protein
MAETQETPKPYRNLTVRGLTAAIISSPNCHIVAVGFAVTI